MFRRHLAIKLNLVIGLLVLTGLAAAAYILICTSSRALSQQAENLAVDSRNLVLGTIRHEMLSYVGDSPGSSGLNEVLPLITRNTCVEELALYSPDGKLVVNARRGKQLPRYQPEVQCDICHQGINLSGSGTSPQMDSEWRLVSEGKKVMRSLIHIRNEPACYRCHKQSEKVLGVLDSVISLSLVEETQGQMIRWSFISGGVIFILMSLCLTWLVNRLVHRPLKTVDSGMARLAGGQLESRLPSLGEDEIGHIAKGFNYMADALEEKVRRLEGLATTDFLTALLNHRAFRDRLDEETSRANRYLRPFSLLMLDIDHFKRINDHYGHQAGDDILRQLGEILRRSFRESDITARYGGEEFAVVLLETAGESAKAQAERLRVAVESHIFLINNKTTLRLTISVGAADYPTDSNQADGLIMAADAALLRAKRISRNLVCSYSEISRPDRSDDPYQLQSFLEERTVESMVNLVHMMEDRDPFQRGHSRRVEELSREIGKRMLLSEGEEEALRLAALLHDIGKIGLPVGILDKPGALTEDERQLMRTHPGVGGAILGAVAWLVKIVPVVIHHHERYDGAGYPGALRGDETPLLSRILAAADTADAMLSTRPYRAAFCIEDVINELQRGAGTQFDPIVAEALVQYLSGRVMVQAC